MSWFARSIANSLKLDDDEDNDTDNKPNANATASNSPPQSNPEADSSLNHSSASASSSPTARGVKEDLSELTKTLTRQFWGVATFLAPPPESTPPHSPRISDSIPPKPSDQSEPEEPSDPKSSDEDVIAGIRSDFAEIGGRFKSGISKLSSNVTVSEFTKIASNLLQFGSEEEDLKARSAVGVTDEVLAFARNISMHPETWLDFPLPDDDDSDGMHIFELQIVLFWRI